MLETANFTGCRLKRRILNYKLQIILIIYSNFYNTKINEYLYQPDKLSLRFLCQHLFLKESTKTFQLHYQLEIINTTTKWYLKETKYRIFWVMKTRQPLSWSQAKWKLWNSKCSTFKTKNAMALKRKDWSKDANSRSLSRYWR